MSKSMHQKRTESYVLLQLIVGFILVLISGTATATTSTTCTIVLGHDWCADALDLLVLFLDLLSIRFWIGIKPRLTILERIHDLLLLFRFQFLAKSFVVTGAFCSRAHGMKITIKGILGIHALFDLLVLVSELFRLLNHLLDLVLSKSAFVICNGDLLALPSSLIFSSNVQDTV